MTAKQQRPAPKIVARLAEAVAARVAARATGPDSVQSMRRITYLAFVTGATTDQVIEKAGALARGSGRPVADELASLYDQAKAGNVPQIP